MKPETINTLYKVSDKLKECREIIDTYLYASRLKPPREDVSLCRNVYDGICKVLDLL